VPETSGAAHVPARDPDPGARTARSTSGSGSGGPGGPAHVAQLLALQATAGNRAVVQLLGRDGARPPAFAAPSGASLLRSGSWTFGKHPGFPATMGQTAYVHNDIARWPAFNLEYSRSFIPPFNHQAKPKTTDADGAVWNVVATPENEQGYKMANERPEHPGLEYYIRVSGTAANTIATAEQQHVNDLDEGWSITGVAAKRAINQAAGEDWSEGDDMAGAKAAAIDKVVGYMGGLGPKVRSNLEGGGSLERSLGPMMDASYTQSEATRDATGKHRIPVVYVTKDPDNTKVLYEADPNKVLDTTASSTVVNLGTIG
jgi:hypothetical protein